jgi:hypothetical protein
MTIAAAAPSCVVTARYRCGQKPRIGNWTVGRRWVRHGCPMCGATRSYPIEVVLAEWEFVDLVARWPREEPLTA